MLHPDDTIVAVSSAPGPGARAVVRLSGPAAGQLVASIFTPETPAPAAARWVRVGGIRLTGVAASLPADAYFLPAPHTYTAQDLVELHVPGCPPLIERLVADLLSAGARAAGPGEFTLRAFLAGKLDLPRAEAVHAVVAAADRDQLRQALRQLAGGVTRPLEGLRDDLLNLLADLEAGLDFIDEDIEFVGRDDLLLRLGGGLARLTLARKQVEGRSESGRAFRVALAGPPNAGKSSLFNALLGRDAALVSPAPGTTRDYLVGRLDLDGVPVDLVDTAGWRETADTIEGEAQSLGRGQAESADLLILCSPVGEPALPTPPGQSSLAVATKCDDPADLPEDGRLATSAVTGRGLDALRAALADAARAHARPPLAPSQGRCRHHVDAALDHLRRAHGSVLFNDPAELVALELRGTLDHLGELVGAVHTDDLLDRIFSRFCIGK
jgi:tRNA modification GTPase